MCTTYNLATALKRNSYSYRVNSDLTCLIADWVVQLGPPTFNGDYYQYSVVTDPYKLTLFVLARNVAEFKQNYDEEVLTKLKEQGFTRFYNRPKKVYQGPDCDYVHLDTPKILQDENTRDKLNLYV